MALYHQPVNNTDGTMVETHMTVLETDSTPNNKHSGHGKGPGVIPIPPNILFSLGRTGPGVNSPHLSPS